MDIFQTLPTTLNLNPKDDFQIVRAELFKGEKMYLGIDVLNITENIATGVVFQVKFKDGSDQFLFEGLEWSLKASGMKALPHTLYYIKPFLLDDRFSEARSVEIRIESVTLKNQKVIKYPKEENSRFVLPIITDKKLEKINNTLGPEIITYAENTISGWRCVCGFTNLKEDDDCRNCKRNKNFVLNNLTEPLINLKMMSILTEEGYDPDKVKINLTQTKLSKVAPDPNEKETTRINVEPTYLELKKDKKISGSKFFKNFLKVLLVIVILLIVSYAGGKFYRLKTNEGYLKSASSYMEMGQYDEALLEYKKVSKNYEPEIVEAGISKVNELIKSRNLFEEGNDLILNGEYLKAAAKFQEVNKEDTENFKEAQDKILDLEKIYLDDAKRLEDEGNIDEAKRLLRSFLSVVKDSAKATASLEKLEDKEEITTYDLKDESDVTDTESTLEDKNSTRADLSNTAKAIINTYQKVKWEKANLRKSPSQDSDVVTILTSGTDLYVKDTQVEGDTRVWCYVEAKDESGKTFEGWISNKVMEVKKN